MALEKTRALTKKQLETLRMKLIGEQQAFIYKESLLTQEELSLFRMKVMKLKLQSLITTILTFYASETARLFMRRKLKRR